MLNKYIIIVTFFYYLISSEKITAQNLPDNEVSKFITALDTAFNQDFLLRNGRLYIYETPRAKGHPFFLTENWYDGDLVLENKLYKNQSIKYDICNNKIICIIQGSQKEKLPITLNNEFITGFTIENHQFINSKLIETLPQGGFYEILYQGRLIQSYANWKKGFLRVYTKENLGEFDQPERNIYMILNNKALTIKSVNEFVSFFGQNKKQVKAYLKKHKIKLFKSENDVLFQLFKFCEEVLPSSR